jgi:hypothetical protein
MRSATALSLLAVGAIFAFAVHGHPRFLNFQVLGWVLILTAIAGLVIPRRGRGWLRRTVLVKEGKRADSSKRSEDSKPVPTASESEQEQMQGEGEGEEQEQDQASGHVERESIVEFIEK